MIRTRLIYCTLHCKLRLFEKILKELFLDIFRHNGYSGCVDGQAVMREFGWASFYVKEQGNSIKLSCFTSEERIKKFFSNRECLSRLIRMALGPVPTRDSSNFQEKVQNYRTKATNMVALWSCFKDIFNRLDIVHSSASIKDVLQAFGTAFVELYGKNNVTPYIHVLCCHTGILIDKYGDLGKYNQQNVENFMNFVKATVHRGSAKGGGALSHHKSGLALAVLQRKYRLELTWDPKWRRRKLDTKRKKNFYLTTNETLDNSDSEDSTPITKKIQQPQTNSESPKI
jgi:hypothetical protein